jgi:site-specific DNA-methyltransferase (cytosine-N4-specific)
MQTESQYDQLLCQVDRIHRFPAKMAPRLAHSLLKPILSSHYSKQVRFHDPMCGSGSTALVARSLGAHVSACDISYPAVVITKAKITRLSGPSTREMLEFSSNLEVSNKTRPSHPWPNWDIWYTAKVLRCLEDLADSIYEERRRAFFPHILTAFFQTIWDVSSADRKVMVPTRSHYSFMPNLSTQDVIAGLRRRLERIVSAQEGLCRLGVSSETPNVYQSNSLCEEAWRNETNDVIMTSPPYGCGIDYERVFRLQMRICSRFLPSPPAPKSQMLGRMAFLSAGIGALPDSETRSSWYRTISRDNRYERLRMFLQYVHDLRIFLRLCARHLDKNGMLCLVIGNPEIAKCKVPLTRIARKVAEEEGFQLMMTPHIDRIRRRTQQFKLRSATGPIEKEFLLTFSLR